MGFNFEPAPIMIENNIIKAKKEIKFLSIKILSIKIQDNLKWISHVNTLCGKIRAAAFRICNEGRHLTVSNKRILYHGWVQGPLLANCVTFLPTLNHSEKLQLQTACNSAVRAVVGLPRFGYAEISVLRKKLNIPSIATITDRITAIASWKRFHNQEKPTSGPLTRAKKNMNLPHPDQRGHLGKLSDTILTLAWNKLDTDIKQLDKLSSVKQRIKKLYAF